MIFKKAVFAALLAASSVVCAGDFETTCTTPYSKGNCPVKVTIKMNNESLMVTTDLGNFFYCPATGWSSKACILNGTYVVINGEFTIRDLVDHQIVFHKTKRIGECFQLFGPYVCQGITTD